MINAKDCKTQNPKSNSLRTEKSTPSKVQERMNMLIERIEVGGRGDRTDEAEERWRI